jgi:hypothetical protein
VLGSLSSSALAQESYTAEALKQAAPQEIAAPIREVLAAEGFKVLDGQGKIYAEIWLRKAVPASAQPAGPKGPIQFPFLAEGDVLGALRFPGEGHDYRDQTIPKGVYTVRYGLQPVNGDHLGVSPFRDYVLLLPAAKDAALKILARKPLEERSAEAAGSSHPAVLLLVTAPANGAATPAMVRDDAKNTWGVVLPVSLTVNGASGLVPFKFQVIVIGAAAT